MTTLIKQLGFLFGEAQINAKGIHLVGWSKIARPKFLGGLGIKPAREANVCLFGKLVWDWVQSFDKL